MAQISRKAKFFTISISIIVIALAAFIFFRYCFVYSSGVNAGDINYFQKEGYVFKTYEGKMIQTGYNSKNTNSTIQSNEFKFSVVNERVAKQIEASPSRQIKLHWKRYRGTLPWRGNSEFIVDSVMNINAATQSVQDNNLFPDIPVY